jgi:hypothetical protein
VLEQDLLVEAEAERGLNERAVRRHVAREQREMVRAPHVHAFRGVPHRQVLERRAQVVRCDVLLLLVVDLHEVAVGITEAIAPAAAEVAVDPAQPEPGRLDRGDAPRERLGAHRAPGDAPHAGLRGGGQLERARRVIAVAAQVGRLPGDVHDLHAEHVPEVPEAPVQLRRQQLDVAEVRDVLDAFGGHGSSSRAAARSAHRSPDPAGRR